MTEPVLTSAELSKLVLDYAVTDSDQFVPSPNSKQLLDRLLADPQGERLVPLVGFGHDPNAVDEGQAQAIVLRLRHIAAISELESQVADYQQKHGISGLLERQFSFPRLNFSATYLDHGFGLTLLPDDVQRLRSSDRSMVRSLTALANDAGLEWHRLEEVCLEVPRGAARLYGWAQSDWKQIPRLTRLKVFGGVFIRSTDINATEEATGLFLEFSFQVGDDDHSFALVHDSVLQQFLEMACN